MRWMMYRWRCEGGGDRAWCFIESVFLCSPDKGFWAYLGDDGGSTPRVTTDRGTPSPCGHYDLVTAGLRLLLRQIRVHGHCDLVTTVLHFVLRRILVHRVPVVTTTWWRRLYASCYGGSRLHALPIHYVGLGDGGSTPRVIEDPGYTLSRSTTYDLVTAVLRLVLLRIPATRSPDPLRRTWWRRFYVSRHSGSRSRW